MDILKHIHNRALAHIPRFSSTPQHFTESVAEHSFYTAYFTSLMCFLVKQAGEQVNAEKAITMALLHDIEETFSGDILGPFKHYSPEVKEAINKVNQETIQHAFADLPENLKEHYLGVWKEEGERKTLEAQIVKVADTLSLIAKCGEEVQVGNQFFQEMYDSQIKNLKDYDASWWLKIKESMGFTPLGS
jgi:5'-deoxynucleotidase